MRGLLLLYGECFRDGHHKSRKTDTPTSYLPQKEASLSHVAFCDVMKKKRCEHGCVDTYLSYKI